jgi:CubicO group peptidase (beta-lactamase class C family)
MRGRGADGRSPWHAVGPLGERLADGLAEAGFAGVVLAVGRDGVLAEVALGDADRANGRPNTPATRFGIASAGKLFTAVTVVRLAERGVVALDTPVVEVLPPGRRPARLDPAVTLEHLLTHTSGIADYVDEAGGEAYEDLWIRTNPAMVRAAADLLPLFADLPPRAAPGAEVRYNNAAFVLLGLAIEVITGQAYPDAVAAEVFEPAGMTATSYPALDDVVPDLALGHVRPERDGDPWRTNLYMIPARGQPDGGAYATAADLVRFLDAFADGRLVGEPWRDAMLLAHAWDAREETHYGLTFWLAGDGPLAHVGHPGGDPGFAAYVAWYREAGVRAALLTNAPPGVWKAKATLEELLLRP